MRRPNLGLTSDFGKDAIESILKIKIATENLIEQFTNQGLIWKLKKSWSHFLLDEMTCFCQNCIVSSTV